jgi:hypothetical protein
MRGSMNCTPAGIVAGSIEFAEPLACCIDPSKL